MKNIDFPLKLVRNSKINIILCKKYRFSFKPVLKILLEKIVIMLLSFSSF